MKNHQRLFSAATAGTVGLLLLTGCLSTHPGSSSIAYVAIAAADADAIRSEAVRVFKADSYELTDESAGTLVFEREATQREQVMFGRYNQQLIMRVVVSIEPLSKGGWLLRADAYTVRGPFADKLLRMSRRPYQNLLDRVKASLVKAGGAK